MNIQEKKIIAKYATFEDCKKMLHNARINIKDWTIPSYNPIMSIGAMFNIFAGCMKNIEKENRQHTLNNAVINNMCKAFGDYMELTEEMQKHLDIYRQQHKKNKQIYKDNFVHQEPIEF